jgi:hypothetical protein
VLSSLVGEEMRHRRKWAVYLIFAALAVIYIVVGVQIDRASEKRESEAATEAKDNRAALLQSQNDLIKAQSELISKSNEIARLNEEIGHLWREEMSSHTCNLHSPTMPSSTDYF